ncbi:zonular occludens toxin domain-containing protein [Pseudoteredinibacter isoporae]|uniref:Zona occludens toxin N-terminal domain-containing protein n=1 Tax=Pseudoteredinibacter isoporae TaxID=570281 RepID=A0A7X0JX61_9GAMM|nr:zonular occludens toxin domain-containing protein [Pseudoteredinibacter isoporae]MBB6523895.1 hypothetical protein [Pseudoteredinibacter isoporae]NHO89395.1 hypothetical protein [Pseudoteredinibacter isoporae]NIB22785.1 hypothetical protein [Pseudoteredinibacter isoporae]
MLYQVTGTPGQGKTLNTIKFVNESKQFKDRPIYYFGIKDLDESFGWVELTEEEAFKWPELPSGSVIIFDEAYNIFPVRHASKKPPEHVKKLATHRHQGMDIILINQKISGQVDPFIKGLINEHHHYDRIFGSSAVNRFVWARCCDNPNSPSERKSANTVLCKLDKTYFGKYHSADQHTHTTQYPKGRIALLLGAIVLCISMVYYAYAQLSPQPPTAPNQQQFNDGFSDPASSPTDVKDPSKLTYAESYTPEIDGMPWTAPVYKDVMQPVTYPKPNCVKWSEHERPESTDKMKGCHCFSQQGTRMNVNETLCKAIVAGGFFDVTRPDPDQESQEGYMRVSRGESEPSQGQLAAQEYRRRHPQTFFLNDRTRYRNLKSGQ